MLIQIPRECKAVQRTTAGAPNSIVLAIFNILVSTPTETLCILTVYAGSIFDMHVELTEGATISGNIHDEGVSYIELVFQ